MAFSPRYNNQQELVSPKQREALNKQKEQYIQEFNDRLNGMPDSYEKEVLSKKRDHCLSRFPVFPLDLSIWRVAYYEDWLRDYDSLSQH